MYIDYILLIIGAALLLTAAVLAILLMRSRKSGRDYRRVLREDGERIDVISTLRSTQALSKASVEDDTAQVASRSGFDDTVTSFRASSPSQSGEGVDETMQVFRVGLAATDGGNKKRTMSNPVGIDFSPLSGKYKIVRELRGGGMSRIFLARHATLGNEWIVKFVDGRWAELANEAEVLKKLNHISLPQIIDIFQNQQGTFLVERYIEGYSLDAAMRLEHRIKEGQICDWGIQLSKVLSYLHHLETPIIHCDLKPSNIMLTHDDRLVLIDFGISKRQGIESDLSGITLGYAAPEQFQDDLRNCEAAKIRFGSLPQEQCKWDIDERTDIYSVGVILYELIMGKAPTAANIREIHQYATPEMADAVSKCLMLAPDKRFQTADELTEALEKVRNRRVDMAKRLVLRRVAAACCAVAFVGGAGSTASGVYVNRTENLSLIDMDPGKAVVTAQQSVQILLQKTKPNGKVEILEPDRMQWSYSEDNIAKIDGDRLVGLNVGSTILYGRYRNKLVSLDITVTEPVEELVEIALRYPEGVTVSTWAGNGEREHKDGSLKDCSFVSPEYLSSDGTTLYCSDSGLIRIIKSGEADSLPLEPDFLTADKVCGYDGALYCVTGAWEDDNDDDWYGILKIDGEDAEFLYYTEAAWSAITDFAFSPDGLLWYIQENLGTGMTALYTLDTDSTEVEWQLDLPDGAARMSFDGGGNLYISVPDNGSILRVDKGAKEWRWFAGVEGERHFIDGAIPYFYRPTALAALDGALYVLDFNTVRKITVEGSGALFTETLAGVPVADGDPAVVLGRGDEAVLAPSQLATLTAADGKLLLGDPKNARIYEIKGVI